MVIFHSYVSLPEGTTDTKFSLALRLRLSARGQKRENGGQPFVHNGWSTQHTLKPRSVESWGIKQLLWFFSLSATIFGGVEGFRALSKMNPCKSWYLAVIVKNDGAVVQL